MRSVRQTEAQAIVSRAQGISQVFPGLQALYRQLSALHAQLLEATAREQNEKQEAKAAGILQRMETIDEELPATRVEIMKELGEAIITISDMTTLSRDLIEKLHSAMEQGTQALMGLDVPRGLVEAVGALSKAAQALSEASPPLDSQAVLSKLDVIEKHGQLLEVVAEIDSFESIAAFVMADQKDDTITKRLHFRWKVCNELATKYPLLEGVRQKGWTCLTKVVSERQKSIDKALLTQVEKLSKIALGGPQETSWKKDLGDTADVDWETLVSASRQKLFQGDRGKTLQSSLRSAVQASHHSQNTCPCKIRAFLV